VEGIVAMTLQEEIAAVKFWWHSIDLGNGVVTPGAHDTKTFVPRLHLPDRLDGKTVLDVGAWDGFYSFECERRGAARVVASDSHVWRDGFKEGFQLARRELKSNVEDLEIDVLDLSPERVGVFDVVICLGVLYHMKHPMLMIERVANVTGDLLILETHTDCLNVKTPAMAFYEGRELGNDPTNWCGPNVPMVCAMLRTAGFTRVDVVEGPVRAVFHARRG
jgi:tRNA (mo5U34)-methyltransferase